MSHELLITSATELGRRIRHSEVSSVDVVGAHIRRIEQVNPQLNALVVPTLERAREQARAADARVASSSSPDELPPLLGVPFTVKELIEVEGLPCTAGVVARRDVIADEDAPLVRRMRGAGGILLGLTNVSEAGVWLESHNRIYGRTTNAYSPRRISGGSSGGEGALIGAGGSPIGIGADIGGSIRNPAFFNGICGHKPSGGLLPSVGHWPPALGERGRYCVLGPMARRVEDLVTAMEVFSPEDDPYRDAGRPAFERLDERQVVPGRRRIFWYDSDGLLPVSRHVKRGMRRALKGLEELGYRIERWRPPGTRRAPLLWMPLVSSSDEVAIKELMGGGAAIDLREQWWAFLRGRSNHPLYSLVMSTFDGVVEPDGEKLRAIASQRDEMRDQIEARLGDDGVLICPPYPRPAPHHHRPLLLPTAFAYCGLYNVLELPATAVPTGFSRHGLPVGVQVVGSRFCDALTLRVAADVERVCGGWQLPG
jgi:fatty acid amide hydrolase 2